MLSGRDILDNVIVWPRRKREEKTKKQKRILTQRTTSLTLSTPTVVPADTYLLTHGVEKFKMNPSVIRLDSWVDSSGTPPTVDY